MANQPIADVFNDNAFNKYINIRFIEHDELQSKLEMDRDLLVFYALNMLAKNLSVNYIDSYHTKSNLEESLVSELKTIKNFKDSGGLFKESEMGTVSLSNPSGIYTHGSMAYTPMSAKDVGYGSDTVMRFSNFTVKAYDFYVDMVSLANKFISRRENDDYKFILKLKDVIYRYEMTNDLTGIRGAIDAIQYMLTCDVSNITFNLASHGGVVMVKNKS